MVKLYSIRDKDREGFIIVAALDPDLDYSAPSIGYANLEKYGAVFCSRTPVRQYQAGLPKRLIQCWNLLYEDKIEQPQNLVSMKGFRDMLYREYPVFKDAMRYCMNPNNDVATRAFTRSFAIRAYNDIVDVQKEEVTVVRKVSLYHEVTKIGDYDQEQKAFRLNPRYMHDFSLTRLYNAGVPICLH